MSEYVASDSHKQYIRMVRMDPATREVVCRRIEHAPGAIHRAAVSAFTKGEADDRQMNSARSRM